MAPSSFPGELHGVDAERRDGEPASDPPRAQSPAARPARCRGAAPRPALARMIRPAHAVASPRVVNIEDLRRLARRRLPKVVFDYVDGGAEGEITLRENRRAFDAVSFRPRHAVGSPEGDLRTTVLDTELALPVLLAPVGYSRLMHPVGEPGAAAPAGAALAWEDLRWLRDTWRGPVVVKGVLTGDDARRAVDEGAAGVVVSNHGGRQLDGVPASLRVLPEVVTAVNGQAEVLMDGGIRRGSDVIKAIWLGARAVLVGRAYAYGLAAAGEAGVARALEILRADMERTLKLLGCASITRLDRSFVDVPAVAQ